MKTNGAFIFALALVGSLAMAYHALRRKAESDAMLARLLAQNANDSAIEIANVYAFRDQKVEALRWLDKAYAQKGVNVFLIKSFAPLRTLSAESGFKTVLHKMNLPE